MSCIKGCEKRPSDFIHSASVFCPCAVLYIEVMIIAILLYIHVYDWNDLC